MTSTAEKSTRTVAPDCAPLRLVTISGEHARYLMMSASVAGGWVLIPEEWANGSRAIDAIAGRGESRYLAALPECISPDRSERAVAAASIASALEAEAARAMGRVYCRDTRESDAQGLGSAAAMIRAALARQAESVA